jgi:NIMA (never in mitosis gene a)-related kinase
MRRPFEEREIWGMLVGLLQGLKALHDRKILHRDLKCANVFLLRSGGVKLGDLNVSKVAERGLVYT